MPRALVVLTLAAACGKGDGKPDPHQLASRAECVAYQAKLFSLLSPTDRAKMSSIGADKPTEADLTLCQQRVTSEVATCALAATTMHDALACKPSVDVRPANARRSDEECARYIMHFRELAMAARPGDRQFAENETSAARIDCGRWMSPEHYQCTVAATTRDAWFACPP